MILIPVTPWTTTPTHLPSWHLKKQQSFIRHVQLHTKYESNVSVQIRFFFFGKLKHKKAKINKRKRKKTKRIEEAYLQRICKTNHRPVKIKHNEKLNKENSITSTVLKKCINHPPGIQSFKLKKETKKREKYPLPNWVFVLRISEGKKEEEEEQNHSCKI